MSKLRETVQDVLHEWLMKYTPTGYIKCSEVNEMMDRLRAAEAEPVGEPQTPIDQMWQRLAEHQPYADRRGYGKVWAKMCELKTVVAAREASMTVRWVSMAPANAAWCAADAAAYTSINLAVGWVEGAEGKK